MLRISRQSRFVTWRWVGAVVMARADLCSCAMSHQMTAAAATNVLPDPLQDRTAVRLECLRSRSISACLPQSLVLRSKRTNSTALPKRWRGGTPVFLYWSYLAWRARCWGELAASGMFFRLEWVPVRLPVVFVGWVLVFRLLWVGGFGQGVDGSGPAISA